MSNKLKMALLWGIAMTFVFCTMSFISILKEEDETATEIIKSFGGALAGGLVAGTLAYLFSDNLKADKMFGKKKEKFK